MRASRLKRLGWWKRFMGSQASVNTLCKAGLRGRKIDIRRNL